MVGIIKDTLVPGIRKELVLVTRMQLRIFVHHDIWSSIRGPKSLKDASTLQSYELNKPQQNYAPDQFPILGNYAPDLLEGTFIDTDPASFVFSSEAELKIEWVIGKVVKILKL